MRVRLPKAAALLAAVILFPRCGGDEGGKALKGARTDSSEAIRSYAADGAPTTPLPRKPGKHNLLLICVDTLRADSLAPWPRSRDLMPRLSAWCKKGIVFREASTAAPWTGPSVASILTGLLPSHHGAREFSGTLKVVDAVPTLAEILSQQAYRTAAFTGGAWVSEETGLLQGFERKKAPWRAVSARFAEV